MPPTCDAQLIARFLICAQRGDRFQWQSYVPTLALLVNNDLGMDITAVGWLYAAFVGTSIIASISLSVHLRYFAPYTVRRRTPWHSV